MLNVIHKRKPDWTACAKLPSLTRMIYQDPAGLTRAELEQLQRLCDRDPVDFAKGLLSKGYQVFRVGELLIMLAVYDKELNLMAVIQQGKKGSHFRALADYLRRLAFAWGCDRIVTTSHDPRVTRLLQKVGAKVKAVDMVMEV